MASERQDDTRDEPAVDRAQSLERGITGCAVASLMLGQTVMEYAVWVSAITLIYQAIVGVALLFITTKAQEAYQQSRFKLGSGWLKFWGAGSVLISLAFLYLVFQDSQGRTVGALIYLGLGVAYYVMRTRSVEKIEPV